MCAPDHDMYPHVDSLQLVRFLSKKHTCMLYNLVLLNVICSYHLVVTSNVILYTCVPSDDMHPDIDSLYIVHSLSKG